MSFDTIVIGAGVAGLAAARTLATGGQRVVVVEARERAGGRIATVYDAASPVPVELGPEFVHGEPAETLDILRAARLPVVALAGERWHAVLGRPGAFEQRDDLFERMGDVMSQLDPNRDPDRSFAAFLDAVCADPADERRALAGQYVEGFHAADLAIASERSIARAERATSAAGGEHQFRVLTGYASLVRALVDALDPSQVELRLGTVVGAIDWGRDGVVVWGSSRLGTSLAPIRARRAVVTLPLGVLQASDGDVRFTPELPPEKRRAMALLRAGSVVRVAVRFRERFWLDGAPHLSQLAFLYSRDRSFPVWWTAYPVTAPLLVGWSGGPRAAALASLGEAGVVARALDSLAALFGRSCRDLEALAEAWYTHDWMRDPYARGAYSYAAVGGADAPRTLGAPVESVLFFAGEATVGDGDIGTVHGAIRSGYRAATELLATR